MKQIYLYSMLFALALSGITGCKKDKDENLTPNIQGVWKKVSSSVNASYSIFNADKTMYALDEFAQYNVHNTNRSIYQQDGNTLLINGDDLYTVRVNGDTMELVSTLSSSVFYIKENTVTLENWITMIDPEQVMFGVFSPALTFDGFELVAPENSHYQYSKLTFINPVAKYFTHTVAAGDSYDGLEYTAGKLWGTIYNDKKLYTLNTNNGSVESTSVPAGGDLRALAGDGTNIYCVTGGSGKIYKYNIGLGTFDAGTDMFNTTVRDMAWHNGYLYLASDREIYKCNYSPFSVVETYYVKDYYISGIAFDGSNNTWLMGTDNSNQSYLLKAQLN